MKTPDPKIPLAPPELSLRALPVEDRPRERLLRAGAAALSDPELLAVLLRSGHKGRPVMAMARDLLAGEEGLRALLHGDVERLGREHRLGAAAIASLLAAVELGRRLARQELPVDLLDQPERVAHYLHLRYGHVDQEVMGALFVDVRSRLVGEMEAFRGTMVRMAVEPRPILREALRKGAFGFILFHTHPSGDPTPSLEDVAFTDRMREASSAIGVRLVDHLILGAAGRWLSLQRRSPW
jgi:DNA repair protein RadC